MSPPNASAVSLTSKHSPAVKTQRRFILYFCPAVNFDDLKTLILPY